MAEMRPGSGLGRALANQMKDCDCVINSRVPVFGHRFYWSIDPSIACSSSRDEPFCVFLANFLFALFPGSIPSELGNLAALKGLYLGGNKLSGESLDERVPCRSKLRRSWQCIGRHRQDAFSGNERANCVVYPLCTFSRCSALCRVDTHGARRPFRADDAFTAQEQAYRSEAKEYYLLLKRTTAQLLRWILEAYVADALAIRFWNILQKH